MIRNFPEVVAEGRQVAPEIVTQGSVWPRTADFLPANTIVGVDNAFVVCGGFLLPLKNPGAVDLYTVNRNDVTQYRLTPEEGEWWYTRKIMLDMNGDGRTDILTGRAFSGFPPIPGAPFGGQMVWLEQPERPLEQEWTMHVLADGDDAAGVSFRVADLNGDGVDEIIAAGYFEQKLFVYQCPTGDWSTCNPSNIRTTVVEDDIGIVFDLVVVDANNDGKLDLVVTNNAIDELGGEYPGTKGECCLLSFFLFLLLLWFLMLYNLPTGLNVSVCVFNLRRCMGVRGARRLAVRHLDAPHTAFWPHYPGPRARPGHSGQRVHVEPRQPPRPRHEAPHFRVWR